MVMILQDRYYHWLRSLVDRPGSFYDTLFHAAWSTPYEYHVPFDENRAEDGLRLRDRYEEETSISLPDLDICSMLEFLVALAIRMNESMYDWDNPDQTSGWFWKMMFNSGLAALDDTYSDDTYVRLLYRFNVINHRLYNEDGTGGGLFPLEHPRQDQREVEVWYQMMAYLQENM